MKFHMILVHKFPSIFKLFLSRIIKTCEISYIFLSYCLYIQILNGYIPPGLDKSCEISHDFSPVISIDF